MRDVPVSERESPVARDGDRTIWQTFAGARTNAVLARLLEQETRTPTPIGNLSMKIRSTRADIVEQVIEVQEAFVSGEMPGEWARIDNSTWAASLSAFQECLPEEFQQEFLRGAFLDVEGARAWAGEIVVTDGADVGGVNGFCFELTDDVLTLVRELLQAVRRGESEAASTIRNRLGPGEVLFEPGARMWARLQERLRQDPTLAREVSSNVQAYMFPLPAVDDDHVRVLRQAGLRTVVRLPRSSAVTMNPFR